ncbi:MAG: hypothetical protein MZU84_03980 [Sphingobacterium sp.]|nr:hypothetical protein [Sphingobacterium sp.]
MICGTGPLRDELLARAARTRRRRTADPRGPRGQPHGGPLPGSRRPVRAAVRARGAARRWPSRPSPRGTPVVSTDNPGGIELGRLFGDDVRGGAEGGPGGARPGRSSSSWRIGGGRGRRPTRCSPASSAARPPRPRFAAIYRARVLNTGRIGAGGADPLRVE